MGYLGPKELYDQSCYKHLHDNAKYLLNAENAKTFEAVGINYSDLIDRFLNLAIERFKCNSQ